MLYKSLVYCFYHGCYMIYPELKIFITKSCKFLVYLDKTLGTFSKLSSSEVDFTRKTAILRFRAPFGSLGATYCPS